MKSLTGDIRFGARVLSRNSGVTVAILLTLALAIGANTAIFTVTNALLLRPFPYRDPAQLVSLQVRDKDKDFGTTLVRYETLRDTNRSFESVAVWTNDNLNLTGIGEPLQVPIARVSPSFLSVLGVRPQLGRSFTDDEGRTDGRHVVMLSDAFWRSRFHADPKIVGQAVTLDSMSETVVGILPPNVQFPFVGPADIWTPRYFEFSLMTPQRLRSGVGYLNMLARLRAGTSAAGADAELALIDQHYREQNPNAPDSNPEMAMTAVSLRDLVVGNARDKVGMLTAAVGVVLLIACANVASLLLSRALARRREIAVRTALGATRGVVFRQLLTESMMIALAAGALGAGVGWAATRAFSRWGGSELPTKMPLGIDLRVLLFTLLVSIIAGLLFGTIPSWQLARVDLNSTLRNEGGGASIGRRRAGISSMLVVGQMALSLLLLIGTGLLLRSFAQLLTVDPGFEVRNVLTMNLSLSTTRYAKPEQQIAFFDEVLRRVSAAPGVRSAAISAALPLSWVRITPVLPEGQPEVPLAQRPFVDIEAISPQWFQTMRVPMRAGRTFGPGDHAQAPPVVIVNETFARQFWPGESALGKHIIVGRRPQAAEVVGVAANVKNKGLEQDTQAQLYLPFPQLPWSDMYLLLRTNIPPHEVEATIRSQIAAIDKDQPVIKVQTVDKLMTNARTEPRFLLMLVGAFSALAVALAVIGIYGMLSYHVAQRRQEFGIRLALGATRGELLRLVLRRGLVLATAGIVLGLSAAFVLATFASSLLYRVQAHDFATFVIAPVVSLCIALLASYLPARRATRAEPIEAIK